jgi:preflagellin peptidase FlaK
MEEPKCSKYLYSHSHSTGMSLAINVARIIFGLAFLGYASYTDIKTRRVKNEVWIVMAVGGGILLLLQLFLEKRAWEYYLIVLPVAVLLGFMFFDHRPLFDSKNRSLNFKLIMAIFIGAIAFFYQFSVLIGDIYYYQLLTIPVLIVFFYVLYQARVLHGGADAKGLMAIAILVPFYPNFFDFPVLEYANARTGEIMELFFPFAFLVLMNAVFFVIWVFVVLLVYNSAKRDFGFPEMLLGYRMSIDEVEKKHVWSMERIVEEERVMVLFPKKNDSESLQKLKELGVKRIWVTPKIPFIVALAAGFVLSAFIGNIFAAVLGFLG